MPTWVHRASKSLLTSTSPASLTEPQANYVGPGPDLSAVTGFANKYWVTLAFPDQTVTLADQATRDAIDAAELVSSRDDLADEIDALESYSRAFALIVMDEINILRGQHGLPLRTAAQLKNALRNRLDT